MLGLLLLFVGVLVTGAAPAGATRAGGEVLVVRLDGTIDPGLAPYLARALRDAEARGASAVVVEINTPGGRLDAALEMRQALLAARVRTIAFIDREAFSAGALIAIAADEIYMADGGVIGAATPVTGAGEAASPKTISAVRAAFKATAEARGRDGAVAEAMVDPAVAIDGLTRAGELLTMTDDQARERGYSAATVADRREVLRLAGLAEATEQGLGERPAERMVRVVTNPALAGLLFMAGVLLLVAELLTSGFTGLGLAGAGLLGLFFWGHRLAGLAGWEGVALVALGLALLAAEIFLLPGFGVAGAGGIAALLGGLFLSVTGQEIVTRGDLERGLAALGVATLALLAGGVALLYSLPRLARTGDLVLRATVGEPASAPRATGVSRSPVATRSRGGARRAALARPPAPPRPTGLAGRCQGRGALRTAPDRFRADRRAAARRDLARRRDPARRAGRDRRRRGLPARGPAARGGRGRAAHAVGAPARVPYSRTLGRHRPGKVPVMGLEIFGITIVILAILLVLLFFYFVPLGLWITALFSGVHVGIGTLIGMRLRKVSPAAIVRPLISATKAGLELHVGEMEAHHLAGGDVGRVVTALISADRANIELPWRARRRSTWPGATCWRRCRSASTRR
jgi:membrane-bound serine protease (ClpP class)